MNQFDAFKKGTVDYYKHISNGNFITPSPNAGQVGAANQTAYRLGLNLAGEHYMVISADREVEYERDVAGYNAAADEVDKFFGKPIVYPYSMTVGRDENDFTAVNPETGERVRLFTADEG